MNDADAMRIGRIVGTTDTGSWIEEIATIVAPGRAVATLPDVTDRQDPDARDPTTEGRETDLLLDEVIDEGLYVVFRMKSADEVEGPTPEGSIACCCITQILPVEDRRRFTVEENRQALVEDGLDEPVGMQWAVRMVGDLYAPVECVRRRDGRYVLNQTQDGSVVTLHELPETAFIRMDHLDGTIGASSLFVGHDEFAGDVAVTFRWRTDADMCRHLAAAVENQEHVNEESLDAARKAASILRGYAEVAAAIPPADLPTKELVRAATIARRHAAADRGAAIADVLELAATGRWVDRSTFREMEEMSRERTEAAERAARDRLEAIERDTASGREALEATRSDLKKDVERRSDLSAEIGTLKEAERRLKAEIVELNRDLEVVNQNLDSARRDASPETSSNDVVETDVEDGTDDRRDLQEENDRLRERIGTLTLEAEAAVRNRQPAGGDGAIAQVATPFGRNVAKHPLTDAATARYAVLAALACGEVPIVTGVDESAADLVDVIVRSIPDARHVRVFLDPTVINYEDLWKRAGTLSITTFERARIAAAERNVVVSLEGAENSAMRHWYRQLAYAKAVGDLPEKLHVMIVPDDRDADEVRATLALSPITVHAGHMPHDMTPEGRSPVETIDILSLNGGDGEPFARAEIERSQANGTIARRRLARIAEKALGITRDAVIAKRVVDALFAG